MNIERDFERNPVRTSLKWGIMFLFVVFVLGFVANTMGLIGTVASAPGRVVAKTLQTDNIIHNYEAFFNRKAQFDARKSQIKDHAAYLTETTEPSEVSRLRMELTAMRQSCRDLATQYNADAQKMNRSLFRDRDLPASLSETDCDA